MLTACYARLASHLAGVRLQLLLFSQFDDISCRTWGIELDEHLKTLQKTPLVFPIMERLEKDPSFMVYELRQSIISSSILQFTSSMEYYLKDLTVLCMLRSKGLTSKGLKDMVISASDLVECNSIRELRIKYIDLIANVNTKGELWSKKFKNCCKFIGASKNYNNQLLESLDTIWGIRNKFSHVNRMHINNISISSPDGDYTFNSESNSEEYFKFVIALIGLFDNARDYMKKVDSEAIEMWTSDQDWSEELLYKKIMHKQEKK